MMFRVYLRRNCWRLNAVGKLGRLAWRRTCPKDGDHRDYLNFIAECDRWDLQPDFEEVWESYIEKQLKKEADRIGR